MIKIYFYIAISLLLVGCGTNTSNAGGGGEESNIVGSEDSGKMTLNKLYIMHQGNRVEKLSDDASIEVLHIYSNPESSIKLLNGDAKIIR